MVFFTLPVAEVPPKVLLFKKVGEARAEEISGFTAGTRPALPGCVQPEREGEGWLVIKVGVIYSKLWVWARLWIAHRVHLGLDPKFQVRATSITAAAAHKLSLHISVFQQQSRL